MDDVPADNEICAHCGEASPRHAALCPTCGADPRLAGRYRLLRRLGSGGVGTTFAAEREGDGLVVAVKELLVRRLEDFKAHDLFSREASVLRSLQSHAVPKYYDDFSFGQGRNTGLYLVTELIDGVTLEQEMKARRYTQMEVLGIIRELCDVLVYLHGFAPPVVHRDIKASNVMRRSSDQSLVLIDFGAVKDSIRGANDGSTVAGTFGYMPPEQLAGRASPASDIYALGVLCVVLLTRAQPQELLDEQNRLQWREHVTSEPLRALLDRVIEPDPNKRLKDAAEFARRLDDIIAGRAVVPDAHAALAFKPKSQAQALLGDVMGGRFGRMAARLQTMFGDPATGHSITPGVADPPPPAPREIPRGFVGRAEPLGNFFRIFGSLFGGIPLLVGLGMAPMLGFFTLFFAVFLLVGGTMAAIGFTKVARAKYLYRSGVPVPAVVTDSWLNAHLRINGASPYKITFRYQTPDGETHERTVSRFRTPREFRAPGAKVYALYDERNPSRATLWPL